MANKMQNVRRQMMENSEELQDFLRDLDNWEKEIKVKDDNLRNQPKTEGYLDEKNTKNKDNNEKATSEIEEKDSTSGSDDEKDEANRCQQLKQKALQDKARGNKFFGEGKYDDAIACYTSGIQADPTNAVLPANRAMALIKKGQLAAAEQDCSFSISLDNTYAKAFHRRGTCRMALKKLALARQDFLKVLELEPGNKFARMELDKLEEEFKRKDLPKADLIESSLQQPMRSPSKPEPIQTKSSPPTNTSKVEMPVKKSCSEIKTEVLEPDLNRTDSRMKDIESSRMDTDVQRIMSVFSDVPDQVKPIYRAAHLRSKDALQRIEIEVQSSDEETEELTIPAPAERPSWLPTARASSSKSTPSLTPTTPLLTPSTPQSLPQIPNTAFQFETDWRRLRHWPHLQTQYLRNIEPESLQQMYQQSMETEIFIDILHCVREISKNDSERASRYLQSLTQVGRFSTTIMFLSSEETQMIKDILNESSSAAESENIKNLKVLYRL